MTAADKIRFSFNPLKKGLAQVLGSLEREIMSVLWADGEIDGKALFRKLNLSQKIALTTVLTVAGRLAKKGVIEKKKKQGIFVYSAILSEEEFSGYVSKEIMQGLLSLSLESASVNFVEVLAELDDEKIKQLSALLESRMKETSSGDKT